MARSYLSDRERTYEIWKLHSRKEITAGAPQDSILAIDVKCRVWRDCPDGVEMLDSTFLASWSDNVPAIFVGRDAEETLSNNEAGVSNTAKYRSRFVTSQSKDRD